MVITLSESIPYPSSENSDSSQLGQYDTYTQEQTKSGEEPVQD